MRPWGFGFRLALFVTALGMGSPAMGAPLTTAPSPGISLMWNDCPGGLTASSGITDACASDVDTVQLVCSIVTGQTVSGVIGAELVVDMQSSDPVAIPDWWRLDGSGIGGCRAGALDVGFDFSADPGCTDAWRGKAFGGEQGFSFGPPDHPFYTQARIKVVAAVLSTNAVTLSPGVTYGLLKLVINTAHTVSAPVCSGCSESACLVFNSVLIHVLPALGTDFTVSTPAAVGTNWATWQGTSANCLAVPVRHTTWGAIKSLYH